MQLKIVKRGFWWRTRFLIFSAHNRLIYECKREFSGLSRRWRTRDVQGQELFYFESLSVFCLTDGRRRAVKAHRGILGFILDGALVKFSITGDQCEELWVNRDELHLHWEMTNSREQVVAAAKRMLFGWRLGYEVDIYSAEYLEEILAFTIFYDLYCQRRNRSD